jgi:hemerythrin superfamily protein
MDAIAVLKHDHRTVDDLFSRFEKAGPRAYAAKRKLVDRIVRELSIHAAIEEQIFYPAVRHTLEQTEDQVLEALEEHHLVKLTLAELEKLDVRDERFDAKVTVLIENVRHHVKEEEGEMFPIVRKGVTPASLRQLGEELRQAKRSVPDRPHPNAPDEPPAGAIAGAGAMVLDRAKDAASTLVGKLTGEG